MQPCVRVRAHLISSLSSPILFGATLERGGERKNPAEWSGEECSKNSSRKTGKLLINEGALKGENKSKQNDTKLGKA